MRVLLKKSLFRLGAWLALVLPCRNPSGLFFFFPFYHVGGAESVHADIVETASGRKSWVIITNRSRNGALKARFAAAGRLLDLSWLAGHLVFQFVLTGYLAALINGCRNAVVFGSNSPFFYLLLPYLNPDVSCVDLIHAFGGGLEQVSLPYVERIDRRLVINPKTLDDLKEQYLLHGVAALLAQRIEVVENKVAVPATLPQKLRGEKLRILYIGRGSLEKRAHLVGKIARLCQGRGFRLEFTLVGDLTDALEPEDRQFCRYLGELHDRPAIEEIYRSSDLLLVTSSREGFPMVIMEAMAHGVVPAATDVGGIGCHLKDGENGYLVANSADEGEIVESFAALIEQLYRDRGLLERLSGAAHGYAASHFQGERFDSYYGSLFGVPKG